MMKPWFVALASLVLLSACASSAPEGPYRSAPGDSLALSVMKAAGYEGLSDAPAPSAASGPGTPGGAYGGVAHGVVGGALDALRHNSLGVGLFSLTTFLSPPPAEEAARHSRLLAWPPAGFAKDEEEALAKLHDLVHRAFYQVVQDTDFGPYRMEVKEYDPETYIGAPSGFAQATELYRTFHFSGGQCDNGNITCRLWVDTSFPLERGFAPDFLGGGPAYQFRVQSGFPISPTVVEERFLSTYVLPAIDDADLYRRLSARLPEWVFLYFAPGRLSVPKEEGGYGLLTYPLVMNQGTVHLFVTPSAPADRRDG